jgi:basic membrane protein A and related proteins
LLRWVAFLGCVLACCQTSSARDVRRLKVGMVLIGPAVGQTYISSPEAGLERAVKQLGVRAIALTPPVKEGYAPSLTTLAREGFDLVFAIGGEEVDDEVQVARRFPHTRFAIIDVSTHALRVRHPPANLVGLVFTEQQVGYLAGYLAALMEDRRPRPHVVSTVGGFSFVPPVLRYIAGFQAGARAADPHIRLLNGYSKDFADTTACKRVALAQIARGSGVVFQVAGGCGLGALEAARDRHVWGIGVDVDQSYVGPSVLTSALKRWDNAVFQTVRRLQAGTLPRSGDVTFTLRGGDLALGRVSPAVPRSILARVERVKRALAARQVRGIPAVPFVG